MSSSEGVSDYAEVARSQRREMPAADIKKPSTVILGLDPGLANCGYGIVQRTGVDLRCLEYGVLKTDAADPMPDRLSTLYYALLNLIAINKVDEVAYEDLFVGATNVSTVLLVARAIAVIELASKHEKSKPVTVYTPTQVKQQVTNSGQANKGAVAYMVRVLLSLASVPTPDHASDALAVAITHAYRGAR